MFTLTPLQPVWRTLILVFAIACTAHSAAAAPDEQTRHAARELAREGAELFDAGRHQEALDRLQRAYALVPAPTISLLEARALVRLGRLIEAAEAYERTLRTQLAADASDAFRAAVAAARTELSALKARIPRLTVRVVAPEPSSVRVELDGRAVPPALLGVERPVDPGAHRVVARGGGKTAEQHVTLAEGAREVVTFDLPEAVATPGGPRPSAAARDDGALQRTLGWASVGVGVIGVATGIGFALSAQSTQDDLDAVCVESRCPASAQDDVDAFERARVLSLVGYAVGVVGIGVGTTLVLTAPSRPRDSARVTPFVGLGSAGIRGRF